MTEIPTLHIMKADTREGAWQKLSDFLKQHQERIYFFEDCFEVPSISRQHLDAHGVRICFDGDGCLLLVLDEETGVGQRDCAVHDLVLEEVNTAAMCQEALSDEEIQGLYDSFDKHLREREWRVLSEKIWDTHFEDRYPRVAAQDSRQGRGLIKNDAG